MDALGAMRNELGCSYELPVAPIAKLGVARVPASGDAVTIPKVSSASACSAMDEGWYFDSATNPTQIVLCPSTCGSSLSAPDEILIVEGC